MFPTLSGVDPMRAAAVALERGRQIRLACDTFSAQCDIGALNIGDLVYSFLTTLLAPVKVEFAAFAVIDGFFAALTQLKPTSLPTVLIAQTEFQSARDAIDAMIVFLEANIPVEDAVNRRVTVHSLSNDGAGTITARVATSPVQLATFKTQLQALKAAFSA